jgi:hypothetical protein
MHTHERVKDIYQQLVGVHYINTDGADRTCLQNVTFMFNTDTAVKMAFFTVTAVKTSNLTLIQLFVQQNFSVFHNLPTNL